MVMVKMPSPNVHSRRSYLEKFCWLMQSLILNMFILITQVVVMCIVDVPLKTHQSIARSGEKVALSQRTGSWIVIQGNSVCRGDSE